MSKSRLPLVATALLLTCLSLPAVAQPQLFNANVPADNADTRAAWLAAIGIGVPAHLVDFETGFVADQNISGVGGLFPGGFLLDDTSATDQVIIRTGNGVIGGSNPVGTFSATHNEAADLLLDFSASPVDYVGFLDVDQAGTAGVITFVGGAIFNFSFETTGASGDSAEFFGIWRNDQPQIVSVALNASGDGRWGLDNIEYGPAAAVTPEPGTCTLLLAGLGLGLALRTRRK